MKRLSFLCIGACFILFCIVTSHGDEELYAKMSKKEDLVRKLAKEVADLYEQRLESLSDCRCSVHECAYEYLSDDTCHEALGTDAEICGFDCKGRKLNYKKSVILTPPRTNPKNLSPEEKVSICFLERAEMMLKKLYRDEVFSWTYIGLKNGIFRNWPATARSHTPDGDPRMDGCRFYDPTTRPWYGPAATGPKDIIFVIDKSESMNEIRPGKNQSKWKEIVKAISTVVETLAPTDYYNVVLYSDFAKSMWGNGGLIHASNKHKEMSSNDLLNLDPPRNGSKANFTAAFAEAFETMIDSCKGKDCSECEKIIVFVTDGTDSSEEYNGGLKASAISKTIERYQDEMKDATKKRISIFTYSLSEEADDSILKKIACENDGFWALIRDEDDITTVLKDYYLFLASRYSDRVVWAEPYIDDFTGENITTVATPIYTSGKNGTQREFIGVVGHDVFFSELGDDPKAARNATISGNRNSEDPKCALPFNDTCEMQMQRNVMEKGATCVDRFPIEATSPLEKEKPQCFTNGESFYKRFSSPMNWDEANAHCEKDGGQLVSIGSKRELEFVASMASDDGSWVGLKREGEMFVWNDGISKPIGPNSIFWAPIREIQYVDCATVDSRGPLQNLNASRCDYEFSFICKYKKDTSCKGKILNPVDKQKGYFNMPPFHSCAWEEDTKWKSALNAATKSLETSDVICPFRKPRTDLETICCDECRDNETKEEKEDLLIVVIALAVLNGVLIIIVWAIIQGGIIFHARKKNESSRRFISSNPTSSVNST